MNVSLEGTTVIFNGHTVQGTESKIVQGWSEDGDALTMPDAVELATVRRGATGDMAAFSSGNRGGAVSIKLLPTSPSVQFFMQQAEILRRGGAVVWNGSVHNSQQNISATLTRGVMTAAPRFPNMGMGEVSNYVFTFEFEDIASNYDAFVTV